VGGRASTFVIYPGVYSLGEVPARCRRSKKGPILWLLSGIGILTVNPGVPNWNRDLDLEGLSFRTTYPRRARPAGRRAPASTIDPVLLARCRLGMSRVFLRQDTALECVTR